MSPAIQEVHRLYAEALRNHLTGASEEALHRAYEVGRVALTFKLGVVDVMLVHQSVLTDVLRETPADAHLDFMKWAADFLAECLAPFEMMLRGYEETNGRLKASNAELTQANAALASAHEALKAEVAERKRAEAALVHTQKLQAVGLLAGGVAHHFNNLLTVVLGNLHLAIRRGRDGEDIERFLVPAVSAAERGAQVVKELLTFSRQQVLEARAVDTARLLADLKPLLASALRGDIVVELDVAEDVSAIRVDPDQLELALLNLAVNARDAMPDGGTLRISARNRRLREADHVAISVADTGKGIEPEVLPRVFEPFFTTKPLGPGAGLGLSQVHGFVHQSGGAIEVESAVGQGATIHIVLPATSEPVAPAGAKPAVRRSADGSGRILVVDDDIEVAHLAGQLLTGCGYQVKLAHHARAALDLLGAGEPVDLLFSDIIMPGGMSGVQLADEVRRRFPTLPILLATGFSEALPDANARALPIITKPYDGDHLCGRVGELIRSGVG